ncbi:HD domain-containing protein [Candidatus Peregrinibacteria bacterium]|nr:HD domain-containing protein [Candidatus Peregrinibacteria bacterium]
MLQAESTSRDMQLSTSFDNEVIGIKFTGENRQKVNLLLRNKPELVEIAKLLYANNKEKAYGFLEELGKINPNNENSEKTRMLMEILGEYSEHSVIHSKWIKEIIESLDGLQQAQGSEIFHNVNLKELAEAIERHDIGKLVMPDSILDKHGMYTEGDTRVKETHPVTGHLILRALNFDDKSVRLALTHHLKYKTLPDGKVVISGYPVEDFLKYCQETHQKPELNEEDQIAAFADVFSALIDIHRPTDVFGTHGSGISDSERYAKAFEVMDTKIFNDKYYQEGDGVPIYSSFKNAIMETLEKAKGISQAV